MADLLSVVVGGLLAVGGGAATQWYLHKEKTAIEGRTKRAAKFEELVSALYEHKHWPQCSRSVTVYGGDEKPGLSPIGKVQAITTLYFPQFEDQVRRLDLAADQFELWMLKAGQKRLGGDIKNLNDGGVEAFELYISAHLALLRALQDFARKEFALRGNST